MNIAATPIIALNIGFIVERSVLHKMKIFFLKLVTITSQKKALSERPTKKSP